MSFPEAIANRVLDKLRIVSPSDLLMLEKIAWARHALVVYEPLQGSEARLLSIPGKQSIITISSNESYRPRQRFSIAHELGHLELHRKKLHLISCDSRSITPFRNSEPDFELQANQFASHLLLPSRFLNRIYKNQDISFDAIDETATQFEVSLTAAGSRYMSFVDEPLAFVISRKGRIIRFVPSNLFSDSDLFIKVSEDIESETIADKLARGQTVRPGWYNVPAKSWLRGDSFIKNAEVKEWSFFSPQLDLTLSLIWIYDDIYDEW